MYIFIGKINQIKSNDMKKFFTLTLLLCAAAIANAAPATIFSLTVTAAAEETVKFSTSDINFSDYADITGGTVEVISTSGEISKSSIVLYKGTIIKVTLDGGNKLQAGDIISFSALADGAEDLAKDVNIFPTEKRTTDIKTMNEYTVTDEDLIHGLETFYFSGSSSTAARVRNINITRTKPTSGIENIIAPSTDKATTYKYVKDGQIIIVRDGIEYNVLGRRIK